MKLEVSDQYNWGRCLTQAIDDMFENASTSMNKLNEGGSEKDAYRCIHYGVEDFLRRMHPVLEAHGDSFPSPLDKFGDRQPKKFIDVGCGVGQKVYLAKAMLGLDAYGLELRPQHAQKARELLSQFTASDYSSKIFTANAITFDGYAEFDYIYFYTPSPNREVQAQIETAVAKGAKIGAIVTPVGESQLFGRLSSASAFGWKNTTRNKSSNYPVWERVSDKSIMEAKDFYDSIHFAGFRRKSKNKFSKTDGYGKSKKTITEEIEGVAALVGIPFNPAFVSKMDEFAPVQKSISRR